MAKRIPASRALAEQAAQAVVAYDVDEPDIMLRTSERRDFKRCPQRWAWTWLDGLKPAGATALPLWFGTGWHEVMAHRYGKKGLRRGTQPLKVWRDYVKDEMVRIRTAVTDDFHEDEWVDARELGEAMIGAYLDHWKDEDKTIHMISVEEPGQIDIRLPGQPAVRYAFTFDGTFRDLRNDRPCLFEHKTAKQISTLHLELDDQAGSYWAIATDILRHRGDIGPTETLAGILYNFARKAKPDERPRDPQGRYTNKPVKADYIAGLEGLILHPEKWKLEDLVAEADKRGVIVVGEVSKTQPSPFFKREMVRRTAPERATQIRRIEAEVTVMNQFRSGALPLYKNPTRDCSWDCSFKDLCVLHEQGGQDAQDYRKAAFKTVDPYADHRKTASGGE